MRYQMDSLETGCAVLRENLISRFAKPLQERESFRPIPKAAGSIDVAGLPDHYELTSPRTRECLGARDRDEWIIRAGNHNTWKWKSQ
jgi:hypothetical protein